LSGRSLAALALALAAASPAAAHDGPPYPILVDEPFGDRTLSVWADPDVGVGTFYLYLPEEKAGEAGQARVSLWVAPSDGRLAEARHDAEPAGGGVPYQRIARVDFDARGPWSVRFTIELPEPGAAPTELEKEVPVTPPGLRLIAPLWHLTPSPVVPILRRPGRAEHPRHALVATAPGAPGRLRQRGPGHPRRVDRLRAGRHLVPLAQRRARPLRARRGRHDVAGLRAPVST